MDSDRQRSTAVKAVSCGLATLMMVAGIALDVRAGVLPPEKLLPDDTVALVTTPNFRLLGQAFQQIPEVRVFEDEALRPFKEKFLQHWREDLALPLERELDLSLTILNDFGCGQCAFALLPGNAEGGRVQGLSWVLVLEARDHSASLATNLASLRDRWVAAGKRVRAEKIRNADFMVLTVSSNDLPKSLSQFLPRPLEEHDIAEVPLRRTGLRPRELVIGQIESLLVVSDSLRIAEKLVIRMAGGALPSLAECAGFQADYEAFFRGAAGYAWINFRGLMNEIKRQAVQTVENSVAPVPSGAVPADKWIRGSGLGGLETVALALRQTEGGLMIRVFLGVPAARRQGIFRILEGTPKEYQPPAFVPADVVKFRRWRLDGPKSVRVIAKILAEISPPSLLGLDLMIDTAAARARELEPGYDLRGSLLDNWGDDLVSYEWAPRGSTSAAARPPAALFLIGSPNPVQLAVAFKALLAIMPGGANGTERELLGHKLFSVPLAAAAPAPFPGNRGSLGGVMLHYAAGGGYVALSTDAALVEGYLRSGESRARALREVQAVSEAAQRVTGAGTVLFGYENRAETVRELVDSMRRSSGSGTNGPLVIPGMTPPEKNILDWMDFSLIPRFDLLAGYFKFVVYGGTRSVDGLGFNLFVPSPPAAVTPAGKQ